MPVLEYGPARFDPASRTVWRGRELSTLVRCETALLERLLHARKTVPSAEQLNNSRYGFHTGIEGNALNAHIHNPHSKRSYGIAGIVCGIG